MHEKQEKKGSCVNSGMCNTPASPSLWSSWPVPPAPCLVIRQAWGATEESCLSPGTVLTSLTPPDGSDFGAKRWGRCQHPWERHTFFPRQKQAGRRPCLGGGLWGGGAGMALKLCWEEPCLLEICPHLSGLLQREKQTGSPAWKQYHGLRQKT